MPYKLKMILQQEDKNKYSYYMGSLLQGVLMEMMEKDYAQYLHISNLHPYSQCIYNKNDRLVWEINCLNEEAKLKIIDKLLDNTFQNINLKHRKETLQISTKELEYISYKELSDQYYMGQGERYIPIKFVTPVSFKKDGEYMIFPSERLIFQSLMKKYDASSESFQVYTDEVLEHYEKYSQITKYRLRSVPYYLEGVKIPAFMGELTIRVKGPQQMVNLAWMLVKFGTFSGIGIKTGLGMGGMHIEES